MGKHEFAKVIEMKVCFFLVFGVDVNLQTSRSFEWTNNMRRNTWKETIWSEIMQQKMLLTRT